MLALLQLLSGTPFGCLRQVGYCLLGAWAPRRAAVLVRCLCSQAACFSTCQTVVENNVAFRDLASKLFACFRLDTTVRAATKDCCCCGLVPANALQPSSL